MPGTNNIVRPFLEDDVFTTGTIGDPEIRVQEDYWKNYNYSGVGYVPRTHVVATRVFRTDGLPGDDALHYQNVQVTLVT